jgi:hypothetical protein
MQDVALKSIQLADMERSMRNKRNSQIKPISASLSWLFSPGTKQNQTLVSGVIEQAYVGAGGNATVGRLTIGSNSGKQLFFNDSSKRMLCFELSASIRALLGATRKIRRCRYELLQNQLLEYTQQMKSQSIREYQNRKRKPKWRKRALKVFLGAESCDDRINSSNTSAGLECASVLPSPLAMVHGDELDDLDKGGHLIRHTGIPDKLGKGLYSPNQKMGQVLARCNLLRIIYIIGDVE